MERTANVGTINFHTIIPSDEAGKTRAFYAALFPEWRFRAQPPNQFWEITGPDGVTPQTAFLAIMTGPGTPATPVNYITVTDLDGTVKHAVALGATVVVGPTPVPGVGSFAELEDVFGNPLGLWESNPSRT